LIGNFQKPGRSRVFLSPLLFTLVTIFAAQVSFELPPFICLKKTVSIMKKNIVIWIVIAVFIAGMAAVLMSNKAIIESKIVKDEVSAYPVTVEKAQLEY